MLREQRLQKISAWVLRAKIKTIGELSRELGVSTMTIGRDLETLEQRGVLRRVRGGAVAVDLAPPPVELPNGDQPAAVDLFAAFDPRDDPHAAAKEQIGRYAAQELVKEGDSLILEGGTTVSYLASQLNASRLTVITNGLVTSLRAAARLGQITLMSCGGILINTGVYIGPQAEAFFTQFRVKKAFFSTKGLTVADGFTDPTPLYAQLKRVMRQSCEQAIVLADSSKLGVRSLVQVMALCEVDILVTDNGASPADLDALRQAGLDVRIANSY
jgi:DeoR/GlpR family transcriptional regulator of sugar metabolism